MRVSPEKQHLEEQHAGGPHRRCAPEPGQDVLRDERLHRKEQEGREEGGEKIERYNLLSRGIPAHRKFSHERAGPASWRACSPSTDTVSGKCAIKARRTAPRAGRTPSGPRPCPATSRSPVPPRRSPHTRRARPRTDPAPAQPRSWPDVYAKGSSRHKGTGSPRRRGPEFDRPVSRLLAPSGGCTGRPPARTS